MPRLDQIAIVAAGPSDAGDLARVHVRAWRETYRGQLPDAYLARMSPPLHARRWRHQLTRAAAGDVVLAAESAEGLVGYCGAHLLDGTDRGEVSTLYVLRSAQRRGLGRRLLGGAARVLAASGACALDLWVLNGNTPADAFYAHMGGVAVGERAVRGWGGGLRETLYRWSDISDLTRV